MPFDGPALVQPIAIEAPLKLGLERHPSAVAVRDLTTALSWEDLDRRCERLARAYRGLGLRPGDRLASLLPNRVELVVHYLAGLRSGLVLTPLNYRYVPPEIDHALAVSGAAALVFHAERRADVQASAGAAALPLGVIEINDFEGFDPLLAAHPGSGEPWPALPADAPCFLYFTSGSTAGPKGVTHGRGTYGAMMASLVQAIELAAGEHVLAGSSLAHIAASCLTLATLSAGVPVTVASQLDAPTLETLLRRDRPSVLLLLPAVLFALLRDRQLQDGDLASIRLCISGGDKVPHQLQEEFHARSGFRIDECYGMTEIGYTTLAPPSGENRIGSVGRLCPGFRASLRDASGQELAGTGEGRLWIQAPSAMQGYWGNPEDTAATIQDGWVDTGDEMRRDDDGYFWFCGRRKQIIVHDSSNICPQDVEEALAEHPAVDLAGVIGVRDAVHGENVLAYVTLRPDQPVPTEDELIGFARARVGYKAPEEIRFLEAMPLNGTGKTDRLALRQLAADAADAP